MSRFDMDRLTSDDVELLMNALTELENSASHAAHREEVEGLAESLSTRMSKFAISNMQRRIEERYTASRKLSERTTLLRAKLILLSDRQLVDDAISPDVPSKEL